MKTFRGFAVNARNGSGQILIVGAIELFHPRVILLIRIHCIRPEAQELSLGSGHFFNRWMHQCGLSTRIFSFALLVTVAKNSTQYSLFKMKFFQIDEDKVQFVGHAMH
jgi:hypothetical protein